MLSTKKLFNKLFGQLSEDDTLQDLAERVSVLESENLEHEEVISEMLTEEGGGE